MTTDTNYWLTKSARHDVRWEKVEHIKRILTNGSYSVPAKRVAQKLLSHMLDRDRAMHPVAAQQMEQQGEGG